MKRFAAAALLAMLETSPAHAQADRVTPIAEAQRGALVTVHGTVERIRDEDEFTLTDASGSIRVYVGRSGVPTAVGEVVSVSGRLDDGLGPRELYARALTRADGTVVAFDHRY